jgi:ubiquinone/menaquinone biosynthesis C-methylase UbiE
VLRLIGSVPAGGSVLDAACGTAPYAGMVIEAGLGYVGADQSGGMLNVARAKWPDARFEHVGLQDLAFESSFDGVMCTDAMENIPPEEWPVVVSAFARALRPGGCLYLTMEEIDRAQIEEAFTTLRAAESPAVFGEVIEGDTAGYHFYPDRERADLWLAAAGFQPIEHADEWLDGYGYRHLLLQSGG